MEEHMKFLQSIFQRREDYLAFLGMEIEYLYLDINHRILNKYV